MKLPKTSRPFSPWRTFGVVVLGKVALSAEMPATPLPPPAAAKIEFERDIRPIFEANCLRCHGPQTEKSHFRLDLPAAALAGGDENTNDIVPGHSAQSWLIRYVARQVPDLEMPPPDRGNPLTPEQIGQLRAWIDQGAVWNTTNTSSAFAFTLAPTFRWVEVQGNHGQFRELEGTKGGFSEGVENFSVTRQISPDEKLSLDGHALPVDQDYDFHLSLDRTDHGFIHAGFDQWRKYYNDTGGFSPSVVPPEFHSDRDLHVDNGRAWIDFGLTLPDWPQLVLGYEYQYKTGNESTLDWGYANGANIYPATQAMDEQTHRIKLDVTKTIADWRLEDQARVDFYTAKNTGYEEGIYLGGATPDEFITTLDNYQQVQGMNTLTVEKQVRDWWFLNGGFYYSHLSSTDHFNQLTAIPAFSYNNILNSQQITLNRESEVFSIASLFTPLEYLSLSLGTQNEWTRQNGFGTSIPDLELGGSVPADSRLEEFKAGQSANFRFTQIPSSVVFGDAALNENSDNLHQAEDPDVFQRTTAADNLNYALKTGVTVSPWRWLDLTTQYGKQYSRTDYHQLADLFNGVAGPTNGYPAFILDRTIRTDQFETRLVLHPVAWLKTTLTYQLTSTEYASTTDPAFDLNLPAVVSPGGPITDGRYRLQTYGISATITPVRNLYLTSAFTYSHSRIVTADNGDPSVAPYAGSIYTLAATATYALNLKTGLQLAYNFSRADYGANNAAAEIPAGLDYTRNDVIIGLTRQLTKNLSGALHYEFSQYSEPAQSNADGYTANGIFLVLAYRWP